MQHHIRLIPLLLLVLTALGSSAQNNPQNNPIRQHQPQPLYSQPPDVLSEAKEGWNLAIGLNVGVSQMFHKTDYERTPMLDYFNSIKAGALPDYTWEEFEDDYDLKNTIVMPRFGFSAHLTYANLPLFINGEFMTSSSGYQKFSYGFSGGMGREFLLNNDYFTSVQGGYKLVLFDGGFGSETMVNSIGNRQAQKYMERFFDPKMGLGRRAGSLVTLRLGSGKYIGSERRSCLGVEFYGELDLTDETVRISRMNVLGINTYMRFIIF